MTIKIQPHQSREAHTTDGCKQGPLVSIVIPTYNHARFLGDAIESALVQTVPKLEIIVVDDGSTDAPDALVARYPGVRYVRQSNQGLAAARNTGIRNSSGQFLVFLDADDRLLPDAIGTALRCLEANPGAAFVSGRYRFIDASGAALQRGERDPVGQDHYLEFLQRNYIGMHATVLYTREIFESVGLFNPSLRACEDYDLYLRVAGRFPVASHEEIVAEYRMHGTNMSGNLPLMLRSALQVLHAQHPLVRNDVEKHDAYRCGVRNWQERYTEELVKVIQNRHSRGITTGQIGKIIASFFWLAPKQMTQLVLRTLKRRGKALLSRVLPGLRSNGGPTRIPLRSCRFGDLRRLEPVSRHYGFDRGVPIDRYYVHKFLDRSRPDVRGRVLEIGGNDYTVRFGGEQVAQSDVLHVEKGNPQATFVGDLANGEDLPSDTFDCIILTQTLHLIYDLKAAVRTLHRILKRGGTLLMTVPGTISQLEAGTWRNVWHWGFTELSIAKLCQEAFPADRVQIEVHGNVLASVAFLEGIAADELKPEELDYLDPLYPLLITIRATKPKEGSP